MPTRLQSLARTVKALVPRRRNTTIRAVPVLIRPIETWAKIIRPGTTTLFWHPIRHTTTFALPEGDTSVESDRYYSMYREHLDRINARVLALHRRAERQIEETYALQQKNARELAELKIETDKLKDEYDDLHDLYVRVCKHYKLQPVELEATCPECICTIGLDVIMFPVSIRNQQVAYEQYNITKWFHDGKTSDPLRIETGPLTVANLNLTPNIAIQSKIDAYKKLMQDTIKDYPLPSDDLNSNALAIGLRRKRTKRKRTNRLSRIIRRKTMLRKYSKKRH